MLPETQKMTSVTRANGQLFYEIFGDGPKVLIAFHGFGQDRNIFLSWSQKLKSQYKILALDLFFHGSSTRNSERLSKTEWNEWLDLILEKEQINRFSVLGYSLGGRFAICTAILKSDQIDELTLIAPDGIFLTPWYKLVTTPGLRLFLKYLLLRSDRLEQLIKINKRTKLVNAYVADFVQKEMGDEENRKRIYLSWNCFKYLGYTKKELAATFGKAKFNRKIILGSKDYVIHPKDISPIIENMGSFQVHILPLKHHQLIKPEVADYLNRD